MSTHAITYRDIADCTCAETLHRWHAQFYAEKDRLLSEVEAAKAIDYAHAEWLKMMSRRIAAQVMAMKQIEARNLELGFAPILSRRTRQRAVIREQAETIARLEAELAALKMRDVA